jgi:ribokinase
VSGPLAVVGAINIDLVVSGARLPTPGETVVGGTFARHQGGKGGNQAVAAARAGAPTVMVGSVGQDAFGDEAVAALADEGVDVSRVRRAAAATGVALIAVNRRGENQISVAPGANNAVGEEVTEDLEELKPSVVLASCEVPMRAVSRAARWARANDVPFVLNPAPSTPRLRLIAPQATVMTPNRGEVVELTPGINEPVESARSLVAAAPDLSVVVTLGEDGALLVDGRGETFIDAPIVEAIDTTGAGDCLNGVLAAALWDAMPLADAVRRAAAAAALSVAVAGAREGMPRRDAIDAILG